MVPASVGGSSSGTLSGAARSLEKVRTGLHLGDRKRVGTKMFLYGCYSSGKKKLFFFLFFVFFFFSHTRSIWKFPGQELNPSHSWDIGHSCGDARSLTPLHRARHRTPPPQRQHQILNWLHHSRNSHKGIFESSLFSPQVQGSQKYIYLKNGALLEFPLWFSG